MDPSSANLFLAASARPVLLVAFLVAEAVVFRIPYRRLPILRVGTWALLSTAAALAAGFLLRSNAGPASFLISFLASCASAWTIVALAARLHPPPSLLRVVMLATAAAVAVDLLAVRAGFLRL